MNEITYISSLIITNNLLFIEIMMTTMWTLHWESISFMLIDLYLSGEHVSIIWQWTEVSIDTEDDFKTGISKWTDIYTLVNKNNYDLLIR